MARTEVFAPAKINLTLHVTGRRADGYHLLDSLVCFASVGDRLTLAPAETLSLQVTGAEGAGLPSGMDNLALRAAAGVAGDQGAALALEKCLPAASGIGGGSADAAAAIRGMMALQGRSPGPEQAATALALGADVPMCLESRPLRASGIGETLVPVALPPLHAVLANPRRPVATPDVFRALEERDNPPMPEALPDLSSPEALLAFLSATRNDLQAAACRIEPAIGEVLAVLAGLRGCQLARMSGSGATCFALFPSEAYAECAAAQLRLMHGGWWIAKCVLGDVSDAARPRLSVDPRDHEIGQVDQ
ncbi:4-(cytidine 5'-diphospho)-2-C-methyl-D-erythritol kinase [Salipiger sp. P9]|uniref:4-(cytidine 5'-diphospho)-2-C-methyl-D-erythritol kinase n=1 Tax=Salipiger pentaromativorans TaxID=2943193 RepID=UPI002157AACD|nr:4-(cytidine 5'-diphospho)-2-C-methyl-D-erythritol kinase [Salipiger pentaromativorans]MCR8548352.1 4-(cytidine 5'-diphospho)-2-C-methyl-D-erythritol kinase [Salipiger pentaromativorans]